MTTFHNFMDQSYNQQFLKSSGYIERLKFQKKFEENLPKISDNGNQSTKKFWKGFNFEEDQDVIHEWTLIIPRWNA